MAIAQYPSYWRI